MCVLFLDRLSNMPFTCSPSGQHSFVLFNPFLEAQAPSDCFFVLSFLSVSEIHHMKTAVSA